MNRIRSWFAQLFSKRVTPACGHVSALVETREIFGEFYTDLKLPGGKDGTAKYCFDCLARMAIRCPWCDRPIVVGYDVTLYGPEQDQEKYLSMPHVVVYSKDPLQLVGCPRMDCADTGMDYAGIWIPNAQGKGHVHRYRSGIEELIETGAPIVVRNL